jgi:hypothetical protein
MLARSSWFLALVVVYLPSLLRAAEPLSREAADAALKKAVRFFREEVSIDGGYLWRYSPDLKQRAGENEAGATTAWVQPPGTPSVGAAYLEAYRRTGDEYLLDAARETAYALVQGQLLSGGWDYRIEFDPQDRKRYAYRVDHAKAPSGKLRNTSTLDDNTTQSALRYLITIDQELEFRDAKIHDAVQYGLEKLLAVQYPNGGWPQRFDAPPDPNAFPVVQANYPDSWPREWPNEDYRNYYTFNDNALADVIAVMFDAGDTYNEDRYRAAARRGGDFILLSQLPDPQPAWAQQYNAQMQPAWARKFEPPSITGGESQGILLILIDIYRRTGDKKYLEPIPKALAYLKKSELSDGQMARFYELKTNRPLYFTKEYVLTYDDSDTPTHYAFKVGSRLDSIESRYRQALESGPSSPRGSGRQTASSEKPRLTDALTQQAREAIAQMDGRGAWIERGRSRQNEDQQGRITTRTFIENVETLSRYLHASQN